jgi:hypothetical protein
MRLWVAVLSFACGTYPNRKLRAATKLERPNNRGASHRAFGRGPNASLKVTTRRSYIYYRGGFRVALVGGWRRNVLLIGSELIAV